MCRATLREMSLVLGRVVLFVLMFGAFVFLASPGFFGGVSTKRRRLFLLLGSVLLGATFAWAFYLGSAMILQAAVLRI